MPLYEYQCNSCGGRVERIQKFSDPPLQECPACGGVLTKLLSSPAIQFKGSGWYITDYARQGKDKEKEKDAKAAKDATGRSTDESKGAKESTSADSASTTTAADSPASGKSGDKSAAASAPAKPSKD